jgi:hypothetical protein
LDYHQVFYFNDFRNMVGIPAKKASGTAAKAAAVVL